MLAANVKTGGQNDRPTTNELRKATPCVSDQGISAAKTGRSMSPGDRLLVHVTSCGYAPLSYSMHRKCSEWIYRA
jgi:hypothetical protein